MTIMTKGYISKPAEAGKKEGESAEKGEEVFDEQLSSVDDPI